MRGVERLKEKSVMFKSVDAQILLELGSNYALLDLKYTQTTQTRLKLDSNSSNIS